MRLAGPLTLQRRALWLQESARRVLACLGMPYRVDGQPPARGLVVSNHLSYLDILIFAAAMPCCFVSKAEVDGWPFFGRAARSGGTLFLDRDSRASAEAVAAQIAARLAVPVPVLLFPEGTSTSGAQVLRFHSRLIEPAVRTGAPITAAAIRYALDGGQREHELCWYGNQDFLPHLWKLLGMDGFSARVRFGPPLFYADRRAAARQAHAEVVTMRTQLPLP